MPKFTQDGSSQEFQGKTGDIKVRIIGDFGGGSVALEQQSVEDSTWSAVYDNTTAIAWAAPDDSILSLGKIDNYRLTLSGSTAPDLEYTISSVE